MLRRLVMLLVLTAFALSQTAWAGCVMMPTVEDATSVGDASAHAHHAPGHTAPDSDGAQSGPEGSAPGGDATCGMVTSCAAVLLAVAPSMRVAGLTDFLAGDAVRRTPSSNTTAFDPPPPRDDLA